MSPSQQPVTPGAQSSPPRVHQVKLTIARPNMSGPFVQHDKPVGVAAWVSLGGTSEAHWMAGYAKSDDMARAAMIHHLLQHPVYAGSVLEVSTVNMASILGHVPGARSRGGLRTNGKPFEAFDVLDPVEAALGRGEWRLVVDKSGTSQLAEDALEIALKLIPEFDLHRAAHPHWWMLRVGRTAIPHIERHEPR